MNIKKLLGFETNIEAFQRLKIEIENDKKKALKKTKIEQEVNDIKKHYRDLYTDTKNPSKCDYNDDSNFNLPESKVLLNRSVPVVELLNKVKLLPTKELIKA